MRLPLDLPTPRSRRALASALIAFATNLIREGSHPTVIATFRLAISEATRSPEIAQALGAARDATSGTLADLLASVQGTGLIGPGEPAEMAAQYLGLVWKDLRVELLLGIATTPGPAEAERQATKATAAFMQLHADAARGR